jgi:hypothetical protein
VIAYTLSLVILVPEFDAHQSTPGALRS